MRWILGAFLIILVAACGNNPPPAWIAYQHADARPGQGLGDLHLGRERLGSLIEQFGVERVAGWFADEDSGIELIYPSVGLHFMFPMQADCAQATRHLGHRVIREVYQGHDFLDQYPACRDLRLSSILITDSPRGGWWQGSTHGGSKLGDLWPEVIASHRQPHHLGPSSLSQAPRVDLEAVLFTEGMTMYFRKVGSGAADAPDRLLMPLSHIRLYLPEDS